ncbi:cytochrome P450 [Pendulispora albinea]|uniref:Cytochrome P450 n=1 Tax=Pendulispora albinea TaxID=2741071 RepID=A0ABZ2LY23_9BACT
MNAEWTLNLLDPEFRRDPYPTLARLRAEDPVHRTRWGAWAVTRYDDVMQILRDKRMSRDMRNWSGFERKGTWKEHPELAHFASLYMMNTDPPNHGRLRGLMAHAFTPASVRAMRGVVESIADGLIAELRDGEPFELMSAFALPLPLAVIGRLFDFPYEDCPKLRRWSAAFAPFVEMTVTKAQKDEMRAAVQEFFGYLKYRIAAHRRNPGEGLVDRLLAVSAGADAGAGAEEKLSEDELLMNVAGMFFAGHETTANSIGNGLHALLRAPSELLRLRAHPEWVPNAVQEFLRFDGSSNIVIRVAMEGFELRGKPIAKGDVVMCMLGAANRDPAQFDDPDRLDVTRTGVQHATYGGGRHFCIGAQLANMELEVAFERLLKRFPRLEVDSLQVEWLDRVNLRGLNRFVMTGWG